jgi:transcriptional regulator with PAS, ATPase and Fis domain
VRELEGVIGSAALMGEPPLIDLPDVPSPLNESRPGTSETRAAMGLSLEEMEVVHAHRVVKHMGGDKIRAAEILGVSRATLYRLLSKQPAIPLG